jgi:hypothetical protein
VECVEELRLAVALTPHIVVVLCGLFCCCCLVSWFEFFETESCYGTQVGLKFVIFLPTPSSVGIQVCAAMPRNGVNFYPGCVRVLWTSYKDQLQPGVVAHAFNPSTWEAEAGEFLSSRPAWWVPGQPGLYRETLSRKKKKKGQLHGLCLEKVLCLGVESRLRYQPSFPFLLVNLFLTHRGRPSLRLSVSGLPMT